MTIPLQPGDAQGVHIPLSKRLTMLLEGDASPGGMSLNDILNRTEGRGIFLVIVFACLPFVVPVSLPGFSTIMGFIVGVLAVRLALGKPPALPGFLGRHVLKPNSVRRILNASVKFLRLLEKVVKPRRTRWLNWPSAMFLNGALMTFMALLMALPVPPILPFTNSLPCYAIILIAVSIMEEDGTSIWLGYAAVLGTLLYFGLLAGKVVPEVVKWISGLLQATGAAS
jgi:hypothetical protein